MSGTFLPVAAQPKAKLPGDVSFASFLCVKEKKNIKRKNS
jgi:hypothetical protein